MEKLHAILNNLESKLPCKDSVKYHVSKSDVAWHIAHSLKVIINVVAVIKKSDPQQYRWRFNLNRNFVYLFGYIPRGKGRAPKSVLPAEDITIDLLQTEFAEARQAVLELAALDCKHNFNHPYFGQLDLVETKKFLFLHTMHHLKIIGDIIK